MCKKRSPDVNPANSGTVECNDPKPPGQSTEKPSDEPKPQIRMCNKRSPDNINPPANKTKAIRKTLKRKHVDQATNLLPKVFGHTEEIDEGVAPSSGLSDCAAPSSKTRLASVKPDRRPRHFGNGAKGASDAADSNRLSDISNVATKQVELTSNCDCHLKQSVRQVHQQLQQHSAGQQQPIVDHRMSSAPLQHHHQSPLPGSNMATSQMPHHEGKPPVYASDLWVHHPSLSAPPPRSHITPHQEVAHHVPAVYVPIFYGVSGVISNLQSLLPPPHPVHHGRELVYYPHFITAAGSFPPPVVLS
mmetsp:Transcript_30141/g.52083  ORF Transcript_30141/g.52083 Transcript_30141/m.52083 type:complete len:303 (-) Transcript_30141:170-1078(-)